MTTGAAVAFVSGYPDVVLPVIAALELIYLAGLSSNPRFQDAVIAAERKNEKAMRSSSRTKLNQILTALEEIMVIGVETHSKAFLLDQSANTYVETEEASFVDAGRIF